MAPLEPIQNLLYVSPKNLKSNPMSKPALPPQVKSSVPGKPPLNGPASGLNGMLETVYDGPSAGASAVCLRLSDATDSSHPLASAGMRGWVVLSAQLTAPNRTAAERSVARASRASRLR